MKRHEHEKDEQRGRAIHFVLFFRKRLHKLNNEEGNQHERKNERIKCKSIFYSK